MGLGNGVFEKNFEPNLGPKCGAH